MALVRLRGPLKALAGGASTRSTGATVAELLRALEARRSRRCDGWILDERDRIRRHINVFVNGEHGSEDTAGRRRRPGRRAARDLRRKRMTELLVGTKKGLFVLEGEPGVGVRGHGARVRRRAGRVRDARPAHGRILARR